MGVFAGSLIGNQKLRRSVLIHFQLSTMFTVFIHQEKPLRPLLKIVVGFSMHLYNFTAIFWQ